MVLTEITLVGKETPDEDHPTSEDSPNENEQAGVETTKEKIEKAGEFVVDKSKNATNRLRRFLNGESD